jgi:phenylpropionate dioxygenase-like ring-hydroxylating dioxygenase large terminal subunit
MTAFRPLQHSFRRRAFWDPTTHAAELDRVFRKCWLFVGLESEIPAPGDCVTRRMAEGPVIVCSDEQSQVRVLLNACRHRGAQLCSADAGNTAHFRCRLG